MDDKGGSTAIIQITVAIIGVVGVLGTALFANWDKIFPPKAPSPSALVTADSKAARKEAAIRFWIRSIPDVPGADAAKLFNNALGSWQAVVPTSIAKADSEAVANVIIETEPNTVAVAAVGPPKSGEKPLAIVFGSNQKWTPRTFEAASCRMLGHILGLGYTDVPGQLMTEGISLDELPLSPQSDDVKKVRAVWGQ